jgi:transposase
MEAEVVVPHKKDTKEPCAYDKDIYCWCHLIENVFQRLKEFRLIATQYEKTSKAYAATNALGCILMLI